VSSSPPLRTVLTTGANSGIGLETVLEIARRGFDSVGSVRSAAKARQVRQAASRLGLQVRTVLLDVTDAEACTRVVDRLHPWAIVNNAGYGAVGAIEDVDDAEAHLVFETMVFAPMRLSRAALPHMRAGGGGRIVNVSSIYGVATTPLSGWYQGAKHALEGLSDALRVEVARDGVKVMLVEPGGFRTGIWEDAANEIAKRAGSRYGAAYDRTELGTRLTMPLMGHPRGVAKVIGQALTARSPRARYLVGLDAQAIAMWQAVVPTEVRDRLYRLGLAL
jgi:NAD(P)-dependent dehydrogenase (short-subunit alcohol dehydrogenase family)